MPTDGMFGSDVRSVEVDKNFPVDEVKFPLEDFRYPGENNDSKECVETVKMEVGEGIRKKGWSYEVHLLIL